MNNQKIGYEEYLNWLREHYSFDADQDFNNRYNKTTEYIKTCFYESDMWKILGSKMQQINDK